MTSILLLIKSKLGIVKFNEDDHNIWFENWKQCQYANDVHTDAGFEVMSLNDEIKEKVPIHLSKLYPDYELRKEYLERKKEFQEMQK